MIRAVLVGWSDHDWRLYRQPQWMAEVRRSPEVSAFPRRHFDLNEKAFLRATAAWNLDGSATTLDAALEQLATLGAVEVFQP